MSVGKSTTAQAIASKLNTKYLHIDDVRWKYFDELKYNHEEVKKIWEKEGFIKVFEYWRLYEAHAVERMMFDYNNKIIDFGAGFSMFNDTTLLQKVQNAMQNNHTFLILPCKGNEKESLKILKERFIRRSGLDTISKDTEDFLLLSLSYPSHKKLADHIIYTENKTPEEVASEIINILKDLKVDLAQFTSKISN